MELGEMFQTHFVSLSLQTIAKVLLQYSAILTKSFPSYIDKEKIVSYIVVFLLCIGVVCFLLCHTDMSEEK